MLPSSESASRMRVAVPPDVERPHRQLRTRLADALKADDSDGGQALILPDRRPGRKGPCRDSADAQRKRVVGHRACN